MLNSYFKLQAELAATQNSFDCPADCNAPGCWNPNVVVEATLFDLLKLSPVLDLSVSALFSRYFHIGLQNTEFDLRYKLLIIKINKPCPFFQKNRCEFHRFKPSDCILFPEYHQIKGLLPKLAHQPAYRQFPCLQNPIDVTPERIKALKKLRKMSLKEKALSSEYLFGSPAFIVDTKPLIKQFKSFSKKKFLALASYDQLLVKTLKQVGLFDDIVAKLSEMDQPAASNRLFRKLQDNALGKALVQEMIHPKIVYRFDHNRVRRLKRSLLPPGIAII